MSQADQTATWVSIGIAAAALALSLFNFVTARRPLVQWSIQPDVTAHGSEATIRFRLVNTHERLSAVVLSIRCPDDEAGHTEPTVSFEGKLPARVDPGASLPIIAWQFDGAQGPTRIEVKWRQRGVTSRWTRWIVHQQIIYR